MFVAKYNIPGKTLTQPNCNGKVYFRDAEKSFQRPNPLLMKITQMTQNFRKNTGKLKGVNLFQK